MIPFLMGCFAALCAWINWGDRIPHLPQNTGKQEAKYIKKVNKEAEKEKLEHKIKLVEDGGPEGYMTIAQYELESVPKDHTQDKIEIPQVERPSDMLYVPQPTYKIVRYNNPPGTPEISLKASFYKNQQQNVQGIVSPDFKMLVYPAVYYYPSSKSVSCDLFVIPLDETQGNLNRIMSANVVHKLPDAILSTDKSQDNHNTFRTLTPIDFSADSTKLLVKEKTGNTADGIWQSVPIVYDFETKTSYRLEEVRDAVVYYWRENKGLNLDDKRWDVYPVGFDINGRIIVNAYGYTGRNPVNLGTWSIDTKGEQSRLVSFEPAPVEAAMNGLKIVEDGVVPPPPPNVLAVQDKKIKQLDKKKAKQRKRAMKKEIRALKREYRAAVREMDSEFNKEQKYFNARQKITGSTSGADITEKYAVEKAKIDAREQKALEKKQARELKVSERKKKIAEKKLQLKQKKEEKERLKKEQELNLIKGLPEPAPIQVPAGIFND
ncbi:MAG: hypothetical protein LBK53_00080 [Heliobacteriaceae bacterium]|jgi:hypothetical protein|nr:hypothetical protein [Heliobacteriaceae bacterium]